MHNLRPRQHSVHRPHPSSPVPDAQARALDRRLMLDEQQRTYQGHHTPHAGNRHRRPA